MPETSSGYVWSSMHSSTVLDLRRQTQKWEAGATLQKAMEQMLAYYWAQFDSRTGDGVAMLQRKNRVEYYDYYGEQRGHDVYWMEWNALQDKVLQDAAVQKYGILVIELKRLGYRLWARAEDGDILDSFALDEMCKHTHKGSPRAVNLSIIYNP